MQRTGRFHTGMFLFLVAPLLAPSGAASAPHVGPRTGYDQLLSAVPADAVFFAGARELAQSKAGLMENVWYTTMRDEAFDKLWAWAKVAGAGHDLPANPFELFESVDGSLAAFLTVGAAGVLVHPGGNPDFGPELEKLLDALAAHRPTQQLKHGAREMTVYGDGDWETTVSWTDGEWAGIVHAESRDLALATARGALDRYELGNGPGGLERSDKLIEARASLPHSSDFEIYVDFQALIAAAVAEEGPEAEAAGKAMEALGVSDMRWIYSGASFGAGESADVYTSFHVPETGMLRILHDCLGPAPLHLGELLPREAASIAFYSFDFERAWNETWDLVGRSYPQPTQRARGGIDGVAQMYGIDLELDFLGAMTGAFATFVVPVPLEEWQDAEGFAMELVGAGDVAPEEPMGSALIVGLSEEAALEDFIDAVLGVVNMGAFVDSSVMEGYDVFELELFGMTLYWSYVEEAMIVSTFPTAIRGTLALAADRSAPTALSNDRFAGQLSSLTQSPACSIGNTADLLKLSVTAFQAVAASTGAQPPLPDAGWIDRHFRGTTRQVATKSTDSFVLHASMR